MKYKIAAGLIAAAWLAAGSATAEPFQSFVNLCLAANGDAQAVATRARAGDWFDVPPEALEDFGKGFQDSALYLNFDLSQKVAPVEPIEMLVTGWSDGKTALDMDGLRLDICGLMSPEADTRVLNRDVTAHLGFPPVTNDGMTLWLFSRGADGFVSETALMDSDDKAIFAAARKRRLYALYSVNDGELGGLMLGAIRPPA